MSVMSVEDAARRLDNLAITRASELLRATSALRMVGEVLDMAEDAFDKLCGSCWAFQCDVVGNCIKISQCWLRPDYFSHLARRFLA